MGGFKYEGEKNRNLDMKFYLVANFIETNNHKHFLKANVGLQFQSTHKEVDL